MCLVAGDLSGFWGSYEFCISVSPDDSIVGLRKV